MEVINAVGLSTISYRAQHTMTDKGEWLIELDRWTIKKLNKLGGLDPHTDKAYWINFRGYRSLYSEATATYFGYLLDKTMNNLAVNINIRTAKAIEVEMTAKRFGLTLKANRTDTIDRVSTDTKTEKALKKYGILYIEQLIRGDRVITTNEIDKINMDAPADSKKYNKWTFQLQKAIRKIVRFESHNTRIESPEHLEICTDGSLYKGIASYGVAVIGHDEMNIGRRITGAQEMNHAELRGILRAITHTGAAHNLTIYSDSFNSVLFCTKGRFQKEKTLRTQKNGNTKIEIKQAIERREAKGLTTKFFHVRSHANDYRRHDHKKRREQNKQRFGKRYREIEKGNEEADRLASIAYIRENITSTPDYTLETGGRIITENTREHIRRMMNNLSTENWRDRQKVWSAFFTCHADPRSLPKKKEPYSNLITKIMTGTIWTTRERNDTTSQRMIVVNFALI